MSLLQHETEFGECNCRQGREVCDCDRDRDVSTDVADWFTEYPMLSALAAVAVIVLIALLSTPNPDIFTP